MLLIYKCTFILYPLAIQVNPVHCTVSVGMDSVVGKPLFTSTPALPPITPAKHPRLEFTSSSGSTVQPQDSTYAPDVTEEDLMEDQR